MPLNYSAPFYYLFRPLIWLIWLAAPLLGLLVCLSKYQSCGHVCRRGGCFSIKKHGKWPHPLGSAGSQIKSALYTPSTPPPTRAPLFTYLFIFCSQQQRPQITSSFSATQNGCRNSRTQQREINEGKRIVISISITDCDGRGGGP